MQEKEHIVLINLPYWDPLIPPMGAAVIKRYLQDRGYTVKTFDLNIEQPFKEVYGDYFNVFKNYVPPEKLGNFYNIGHDVLQNHMMAHIHYQDEQEYKKLVKLLIDQIFFCNVEERWVLKHIQVMEEFYNRLDGYFSRLLEKESPTVLGITAYKATLPAAIRIFKKAREQNPAIRTTMGGGIFADTMALGSPNLENFLEHSREYIDKIMIGSGEHFMLKFLRRELPEEQRLFTLKDVRDDESGPFPRHLPDLSDFDLSHYPYLAASGSKSCPYQCSFCNSSIYYGEYVQKEVSQTVHEMNQLHETYGFKAFFMTDALLNPIISQLAAQMEKNPVTLYYDGYFRVDEPACHIENTLNWRKGGFYRARIGVESGSQRILDEMDKKITVEQTRKALRALAHAGIKATAYIVIGHPGETEQDFQATLRLMEEVKNDIWQAECVPFAYYYNGQPGSDRWASFKKLLFPEQAQDMLMLHTWVVDKEPCREEIYNRVFRFTQHCKKLGIPNPYALNEIYRADERWQKLHRNAVPPLVELMDRESGVHSHESKNVKEYQRAENRQKYHQDFCF